MDQRPTPEDIRRNDRERLIETLTQPVDADEEDKVIAMRVQKVLSADAIAVALVQAHRTKMPALEDMLDANTPPERGANKRQGFDDTVWFRINIGRQHNADPRWILPLLCRRGHITKNEVGAIKIGASETQFDIPRGVAARFADALKRTAQEDPDDGIMIEPMEGSPRVDARENRRKGPPPTRPGGHAPKPYRGKPRGRV